MPALIPDRNKVSRSFREANPHLYAPTHPSLPDTQPERDQAPALGSAVQGEAAGLRRTRVCFTGYRVRPLDPDNFAGGCKDLLDGLRHAALIPGDEPWRIRFETDQIKVSSYKEERTEIQIEVMP